LYLINVIDSIILTLVYWVRCRIYSSILGENAKMIEVRLFGDLSRRVASESTPGTPVYLQANGDDNVGTVLTQLQVDPESVGNIFLNGRLLPRSAYPITLGYQLVTGQPLSPQQYLLVPVKSGDRIGIFPTIMCSVVV
jgi:hypothetical protein